MGAGQTDNLNESGRADAKRPREERKHHPRLETDPSSKIEKLFGRLIIDGLESTSQRVRQVVRDGVQAVSGSFRPKTSKPISSATAISEVNQRPAGERSAGSDARQASGRSVGRAVVDGLQAISQAISGSVLARFRGAQRPATTKSDAGEELPSGRIPIADSVFRTRPADVSDARLASDMAAGGERSLSAANALDSIVQRAEQIAEKLREIQATESDGKDIFRWLNDSPQTERQAVAALFARRFGLTLEEELRRVLFGTSLTRALHLLHRTDTAQGAEQIFAACSAAAAEEDTVIRVLSRRTPTQLRELERYYRMVYGVDLEEQIARGTSGLVLLQALDLLAAGRGEG